MALADRNGLYGVARFHTSARHNQVKAHIGAEIAVSSFGNRLIPQKWLPHQYIDEPPRIVLLCASQIGYQNLCQLITRFKMREDTKAEGAANFEDLEEFSSGLICLTGGEEGPLAATLSREGAVGAHKALDRLTSIYGHNNVYVELQRHLEREEEVPKFRTSQYCFANGSTNHCDKRCALVPNKLIVNFSTYLLPFAITRVSKMLGDC